MITSYIIQFLVYLAQSIVSTFDALIPNPPSWWASVSDAFGSLSSIMQPVGWWLPTGTFVVVAGTILALELVHLGLILARRIASYMTLGGGSL